jgi:ribosomal protein L13E
MKVIDRKPKAKSKGLAPAYESLMPAEYTYKKGVTRGTKAQRSGRGFTITEPK